MAKGLYGGFSVDGSVVGVRSALNKAYYGKEVTPTDTATNPQAGPAARAGHRAGRWEVTFSENA